MSEGPSTPRYPTADEEASWTAAAAALDEFLAAFRQRDGDAMGTAQTRMLAVPIDWDACLNAIRVPGDAGEWSADLEAMLRRIPDGWGRWIRVGPGWYPIVVALDRKLAALFPDYRLLQVKEKFGGLRYYWERGEGQSDDASAAAGKQLVELAEALAARTCEMCGRPGALTERQRWFITLCAPCAENLGYSPAADDS